MFVGFLMKTSTKHVLARSFSSENPVGAFSELLECQITSVSK